MNFVQFKLDSISIELQYENGIFQYALTRGDGKIGDDVSANVINMKGFIPKLKTNFTGATRAEVLLYHDIFEKKYSDKQNCRNAASGLVRRKDGVGSGDLNLVFYDAVSSSDDIIFHNEILFFFLYKLNNQEGISSFFFNKRFKKYQNV
ncbi:MAG: hypothetical protein ACFFG0_25200 [Candidatus Thorarchaeota archaeon]